jgi:hypothetical protein
MNSDASGPAEGDDAPATGSGPVDSWEARYKGLNRTFQQRQTEYERDRNERARLELELIDARARLAATTTEEDEAPPARIDSNSPRRQPFSNPVDPSAADIRDELLNMPVDPLWGRPRSGKARVPQA